MNFARRAWAEAEAEAAHEEWHHIGEILFKTRADHERMVLSHDLVRVSGSSAQSRAATATSTRVISASAKSPSLFINMQYSSALRSDAERLFHCTLHNHRYSFAFTRRKKLRYCGSLKERVIPVSSLISCFRRSAIGVPSRVFSHCFFFVS